MSYKSDFNFEQLYGEHGSSVFRLGHRLLGSYSEAEDLTQDVFVAALVGKERFRGDSSIRTWLFRIAAYKARERLIKRKRNTSLLEDYAAEDNSQDLQLDLWRHLEALPEKLKEAFVLVKLEGCTSAEAAKILRLPEGTVKFHVYSAVRQLQNALIDVPSAQKEISNAL